MPALLSWAKLAAFKAHTYNNLTRTLVGDQVIWRQLASCYREERRLLAPEQRPISAARTIPKPRHNTRWI